MANMLFFVDGVETYDLNCHKGVTDDVVLKAVEAISQHPRNQAPPNSMSELTIAPTILPTQNFAAECVIAAIDAELERR